MVNDPTPAFAELNTLYKENDGRIVTPKSRINSATQVREIYNKAVRDNDIRSRRNAMVKGLIDGNPPYDQSKLDSAGQKYRANFNNGEGEAYMNAAKDAFYDLFSEVPHRVTVTPSIEFQGGTEIAEKIQYHFDWLLKQDNRFDFNMQVSQHDMVLYGMGPLVFEDDMDWRPKFASATNIYLPKDAPSRVQDWPWVIVYRRLPVGELYKFISDEESATKVGWNVSAVKEAIIRGGNKTGGTKDWQKWETWQQVFRDGDLWISETTQKVSIIQLLFAEFSVDGAPPKISEIWVSDQVTESDDYLFKRENRYDDFSQVIHPMFYDRGDGSAHGVRGLGQKMHKLLTAKMRLQNATVDSAFARSAILIKSMGSQNQNTMSPISIGPYTIVPQGFEVVTGLQAAGIIDAPLAVSRDLENTLNANLGQYRARIEKPEGNPRTAFEVAQTVSQASSLAKTQIARYYEQLDELYTEQYRRAINSDIPKSTRKPWLRKAVEFQERCLNDGVPPQAFNLVTITATRTVGQGSQIMRIGMLNQIMATLGGMLPEDGKTRLTRDLIAAQAGQDSVSRYLPQPPQRTYEATQRWEAQVENGSLKEGGQITLTPYQNDVVHLQEHISFASQAAASVQQGAEPHEVWVAMNATGQHCALHLQRLAQNPQRQREFKAIKQQFDQLARVADQIKQHAQESNPEPMSPDDPEMQLEVQKTQAELALKKQKQDATLQLKAQKQAFDSAMKARKFQFESAITDAKTAHDMHLMEQAAKHEAASEE